MYQFPSLPLLPQAKNSASAAGVRHGLVLVAVLIVTVLLALAAYNYTNWGVSEYRLTVTRARQAQAKASADSAVHYLMAMMADPEGSASILNGNVFDNPPAFLAQNLVPNDQPKFSASFSILSPREGDPYSAYGPCCGVMDESRKLNLNAYMAADPTGNSLYNALMLLPNMTDPVANSIVYWLDPTQTERSSGGDVTYYSSLSPPFPPTSGPAMSLEELLLVQGVTAQFLFGDDLNRNGIMDGNESLTDPTGWFGRGWTEFLTIYPHEPNISAVTGAPRIYLNDTVTDLPTQLSNLTDALGSSDMATYILLARVYNLAASTTATTGTTMTGGAGGAGAANATQAGTLGSVNIDWTTVTASGTITSVFSLINTQVSVPATGNGGRPTVYQSPLNDSGDQATLLPLLLDLTTPSTNTEMLGRINVNTATTQVLSTLPGLQVTDVANIVTNQPIYLAGVTPDPSYSTIAWLMTACNFTAQQMQMLEPYITTYCQAYSFQACGYFDGGEPTWMRVEVVVDINPVPSTLGIPTYYPRILYYRPTELKLGPGWDLQSLAGNGQ